jgi:hypothetical protein
VAQGGGAGAGVLGPEGIILSDQENKDKKKTDKKKNSNCTVGRAELLTGRQTDIHTTDRQTDRQTNR